METVAPGFYRHYKGGIYLVVMNARHTERDEVLVIYRAHGDPPEKEPWARPVYHWNLPVLVDGREVPRYQRLPLNDKDLRGG